MLKPNVRASFVVDTLTYLYRGGRCNAVAAMAGGVLKLHPRIVVENGVMNASKKYRGKINSVIMDYVKDMEKDGLHLYIDVGYVKADRTTLGADDGIAVAYALAILDSKDVCHPPIEAVFTVDEEIGMLGAEAINSDCLDG